MFTRRSKNPAGILALAVFLALLVRPAPSAVEAPEPPRAQPPASPSPKLLVIVVVDQLRFDYLDRYSSFWEAGLERLTKEAAVFERAYYPYLNTVTCAGHATIATGSFPSTHGIIMNEWFQRARNRRMSCTDDPTVTSIPYNGAPEAIGHSAHRLRMPTIADRLRAVSSQSRVVTLSMKPRSTVMLAGHGATAVTWFASSNVWATSSAYTLKPVPQVQWFIARHPVDRDRHEVWQRTYDAARYSGEDGGTGERPPPGWGAQFPHPLAGAAGASAARFYDLWERSPYADAYLAAMAGDLVRSFQLGQRGAVDYLGLSFSALDYIGHDFGPNSQEVQDALIRLDRTLGHLFAALDTSVGRDRYVVGLSADHGVAEIPETRTDAGRLLNAEVRRVAEAAMVEAHGPGPHVALVEYTNIYLTEAARKRVTARPAAVQPLIDAVSRMNGVMRVLPSAGLESKLQSRDPIERAAALSHYPGESGEVIVILKPNWIGTDSSAATHGSLQSYDQHVPVILMGAPFKPGRYAQPASPADLAPTLASLIGLGMAGTDGRVLREAIK